MAGMQVEPQAAFPVFLCLWEASPSWAGHSGSQWGMNMQKQIKDMVPVLKKLLVSSEDKTHTH